MKSEVDLAIEKYGVKFKKIFETELIFFAHPLFRLCNVYFFDIVGFDKWLHRKGYSEEKHGSIKDYVILTYGEESEKFLEEVMDFKRGEINE